MNDVIARLGQHVFSIDGQTMEEVVGRHLRDRGFTIALAESCTGGLIAHRLTQVAGSSAYVDRGVVCYDNRAKIELLGVSESSLKKIWGGERASRQGYGPGYSNEKQGGRGVERDWHCRAQEAGRQPSPSAGCTSGWPHPSNPIRKNSSFMENGKRLNSGRRKQRSTCCGDGCAMLPSLDDKKGGIPGHGPGHASCRLFPSFVRRGEGR